MFLTLDYLKYASVEVPVLLNAICASIGQNCGTPSEQVLWYAFTIHISQSGHEDTRVPVLSLHCETVTFYVDMVTGTYLLIHVFMSFRVVPIFLYVFVEKSGEPFVGLHFLTFYQSIFLKKNCLL